MEKMEFKIGETCDGCDAIIKGLKKYEGKNLTQKIETDQKVTDDLKKFMKKSVDDSATISKKLSGKLKDVKYKKGK